MKPTAKNKNLGDARRAKNDEFYTQRTDIEAELHHYDRHFKNKVVYCNCDDPRVSEFYLYFKRKFRILGLKKLIASTYRNPDAATRRLQEDLLAEEDEKYAVEQTEKAEKPPPQIQQRQAVYIEYEGGKTGRPRNMHGDGWYHGGDFRSGESIALLKQADIVVTNPPFSLFREYVTQLMKHKKKFVILGNANAITFKEIFPLLKENKVWLGPSISSGDREFGVPDHYPLHAAGFRVDEGGNKFIRVKGVRWYTNLDYPKRHEDLLVTKRYTGNESDYPKYENYNAINVDAVKMIPKDYVGVMGVPITFLDKHNPDQFEIVGTDYDVKDGLLPEIANPKWQGKFDRGYVDGSRLYSRILIRHRHPQT